MNNHNKVILEYFHVFLVYVAEEIIFTVNFSQFSNVVFCKYLKNAFGYFGSKRTHIKQSKYQEPPYP